MGTYKRHDSITYMGGPFGAVNKVGDTKFLDHRYDARDGDAGYYIEPIEIGGMIWHVTSKVGSSVVRKSSDNPDGRLYRGPFIIMDEAWFRHTQRNHAAIEGRVME